MGTAGVDLSVAQTLSGIEITRMIANSNAVFFIKSPPFYRSTTSNEKRGRIWTPNEKFLIIFYQGTFGDPYQCRFVSPCSEAEQHFHLSIHPDNCAGLIIPGADVDIRRQAIDRFGIPGVIPHTVEEQGAT